MPNSTLPPITKWENVASPKGAVHIIHGLAEHAERYDEFAKELNTADFIVWAHHQRGHGKNIPIKGHFADHDGWRLLIDDAWAVSKQLIDEKRLPLAMFAHSMGSFVGQGVLAEHGASYRVAVFSGTNGPPTTLEEFGHTVAELQVKVLGPRHPGIWLQTMVFGTFNLRFGIGAPPNTWLSRDSTEVDKYNCDDLCGFPLTSQAWLDLSEGRIAQGTVEFFKRYPPALPIHIIAGTADPVGEQGKGVERLIDTLGSAGLTDVSCEFYKDARHELLHETNKAEVTKALIDWLKTRFP